MPEFDKIRTFDCERSDLFIKTEHSEAVFLDIVREFGYDGDAPERAAERTGGKKNDEFRKKGRDHSGQRQRSAGGEESGGHAEGAGDSLCNSRILGPPDAGRGPGFCPERPGGGLRRDHSRGGHGGPSGRGPGGEHDAAGDWHSLRRAAAGRPGRAAFHCADALRDSGGHRGGGGRSQRGAAGGGDAGALRSGADGAAGKAPAGGGGSGAAKGRRDRGQAGGVNIPETRE